jgi:hypothetical protein
VFNTSRSANRNPKTAFLLKIMLIGYEYTKTA